SAVDLGEPVEAELADSGSSSGVRRAPKTGLAPGDSAGEAEPFVAEVASDSAIGGEPFVAEVASAVDLPGLVVEVESPVPADSGVSGEPFVAEVASDVELAGGDSSAIDLGALMAEAGSGSGGG